MKLFKNLFNSSKSVVINPLNQSLSLNNTNFDENKMSPNFNKILNNLENNSIIKKVENNFNLFSNNKSMLRTIVDESPQHEDIFKNIVRKSKSSIPNQPDDKKDKISLFLPIDDILLYSYIPDENFGMSDLPKHKDYNFRIELPEYKTFAYIFLRDNFNEFLDFIDKNFEPIIYSTGEKLYVDKILQVVDPNNIFKIKLYQQDCHLYKDKTQNYLEYLKDINLFTNRKLEKKILLDTSSFNYLLSPDNGKI